MKQYIVKQHPQHHVEAMAATVGLHPIVVQMCFNRELNCATHIKRFVAHGGDAHLLENADDAAQVILEHIERESEIAIFGDYDCDGVCSTAIMYRTIKALGGHVSAYLPERRQGYGLNMAAVREMYDAGANLAITVDCGITAVSEVETFKTWGVPLIVTDHHEPKAELPKTLIVHPKLPGRERFTGGDICGAGVALHVAGHLLGCGKPSDSAHSLHALAAIATVADVVPLVGENRSIVRQGLIDLNAGTNLIAGLPALMRACGVSGKPMTAQDLAFMVCPAINAAGRMKSPTMALNLFTSDCPIACEGLAAAMVACNTERKKREKEALKGIEVDDSAAAIVVVGKWNGGLSGIIAGRLAEKYGKPVLAISGGRGSGRSRCGLPLNELLAECGDLLISHGGHAAAAGFAVDNNKTDAFRVRFCEAVAARGQVPDEIVNVDAEVKLGDLTTALVSNMDELAPFGAGNPEPLLIARDVLMRDQKDIGDKSHVSFKALSDSHSVRCVFFGGADKVRSLTKERNDLVFTPQISNYGPAPKVELRIREVL